MIKGWDTNDDGTYYFDLVTGAMTKGDATIDGLPCSFDTVTGIGLNCAWKRINGKDYWYEAASARDMTPTMHLPRQRNLRPRQQRLVLAG